MGDPEGKVKKISYRVGRQFQVYLDGPQSGPFVAKDLLVQQTLAVVLAVQEEVFLPLEGGFIQRVQRKNPIPKPVQPQPPAPVSLKITGIATQVNGDTGKSFFEIFVNINGTETQYRSSDAAVQALCLTACGRDTSFMLMANQDKEITDAILEISPA